MDNHKWTPGPWKAVKGSEGYFDKVTSDSFTDGGLVALTYSGGAHDGAQLYFSANAKLIASAPDLYAENLKLKEALNLSQAWITKIHDGLPDSGLKKILAAGIQANAAQLESTNQLLK